MRQSESGILCSKAGSLGGGASAARERREEESAQTSNQGSWDGKGKCYGEGGPP